MTYTKGPWEWLYAETHHDGIGRVVTAQVVDVTTSQCVVEFSNTSHSEIIYEDDGDGAGSFFDVQARANARLISAAPDMYEALDRLMRIIASDDPWDREHVDDMNEACDAARSALLKAKGEA